MPILSNLKRLSLLASLAVPTLWSASLQAGEHWVWADRESATLNQEYTPNPYYAYSAGTSYNPTGTNLRVKRTATGQYQVIINGYGVNKGTVHVTAYGSNNHCKVASWGATTTGTPKQIINVFCFNEAGSPINNKFSLAFYDLYPSAYSRAYLWANQPSSSSYIPSMSYQFNSRSAINSVRRLSTGLYEVTMPQMQQGGFFEPNKGGTVLVTAYGTSSQQCKASSWFMSGNNLKATVRCFNSAGQAADSAYTISFMRTRDDPQISQFAYVWANDPNSTTSTPLAYYSYNNASSSVTTMQRTGTGTYTVKIVGQASTRSNVQVTAYGTTNSYCNVNSWVPSSGNVDIQVRCYNDQGIPINSQFVLQYFSGYQNLI